MRIDLEGLYLNLTTMLYRLFILIIFIFCIECKLIAQIQILDAEKHILIPYVEIYSSDGDLIGLSDNKGIVSSDYIEIIRQLEKDYISFNHISYNEIIIPNDDFDLLQTIKMTPKLFTLDEVQVIARRKARKKEYIKIDGYYRSFQINDDIVKYYEEGMVSYYLSSDATKVWNVVSENRSFINKNIKDKVRFVGLVVIWVGPPRLGNKLTIKYLEKKYDIQAAPERFKSFTINLDQKKIGRIEPYQNQERSLLEITFINKDKPEEFRLFAYHMINEYDNRFAIYNTTSLDSMNNENLSYCKRITSGAFKHKKDKKYKHVEAIDEFFVIGSEIVQSKPKRKLLKRSGHKEYSNYENEFWKEIKHPFYTPLPQGVKHALETYLTEFENVSGKK